MTKTLIDLRKPESVVEFTLDALRKAAERRPDLAKNFAELGQQIIKDYVIIQEKAE